MIAVDWIQIVTWTKIGVPLDSRYQVAPVIATCDPQCAMHWARANGAKPAEVTLVPVLAKDRGRCGYCGYCGRRLHGTPKPCLLHDDQCPEFRFVCTITAAVFAKAYMRLSSEITDDAWDMAERFWACGTWEGQTLALDVVKELRRRQR